MQTPQPIDEDACIGGYEADDIAWEINKDNRICCIVYSWLSTMCIDRVIACGHRYCMVSSWRLKRFSGEGQKPRRPYIGHQIAGLVEYSSAFWIINGWQTERFVIANFSIWPVSIIDIVYLLIGQWIWTVRVYETGDGNHSTIRVCARVYYFFHDCIALCKLIKGIIPRTFQSLTSINTSQWLRYENVIRNNLNYNKLMLFVWSVYIFCGWLSAQAIFK